jgi:hypothetical protein
MIRRTATRLRLARASRRALALLVTAALLLAGCVAPIQRQTPQLRRTEHVPTVVVMPIDLELSELTAGGLEEPRADWTDAALKNWRAALEARAEHYRVKLVDYRPDRGTPEEQATSLELQRLHRAVGSAVLAHHYQRALELPTKGEKFDWSLGPAVAAIAQAQGADYALFLYVRDSYVSPGRVALIVVAAVLGTIGIPGGAQVGFASMVDLKTGDIVWFNRLARGSGDLRTPEAAAETVDALVSDALK